MRHGRSRIIFLRHSRDVGELPGAIRLPPHDAQRLAAARLGIGRILVREVSPFKGPVAGDLHVLDLRFVAKRIAAVGLFFPALIIGVNFRSADLDRAAGLNADSVVVPKFCQFIGLVS